jgi:putative transposase
MNHKPTRKRHRLPLDIYSNPSLAFSLTICTYRRRRLFTPSPFTAEVFSILTGWLESNCNLIAATIVPDHLHLLLSPQKMDIPTLVANLKRKINMVAKKFSVKQPLWQSSYYDHSVRKQEGLPNTARYILENPVRLGLCGKIDEYPYNYLSNKGWD